MEGGRNYPLRQQQQQQHENKTKEKQLAKQHSHSIACSNRQAGISIPIQKNK